MIVSVAFAESMQAAGILQGLRNDRRRGAVGLFNGVGKALQQGPVPAFCDAVARGQTAGVELDYALCLCSPDRIVRSSNILDEISVECAMNQQ